MDQNLFRFIWRHSHKSQIAVLLLIVVSLPFYFASLDIPKIIVNEAIQGKAFVDGNTTAKLFHWTLTLPSWLGGGQYTIFSGFDLERTEFLLALSFLFLFLVLITGAFKAVINLSKGVLGERMLRRLRFMLFQRLLLFSPEHIRAVKPAEAASMINNEAEPIGGFIGDAFIQPAFLTLQAATALFFIVIQSFWLGMIAVTVVVIQSIIIPYLRREQLRLGRMRQLEARQFSGRIGEVVDGAPVIHTHGTSLYNEAEIGGRLSRLFDIRVRLFKRKFAVKFLNNLLAKVTPFFFYAVGGYLAVKGSLDIGQLIAVIGAYRELPPPIRELINWDQRRADVTIKYQQVLAQFGPDRLRREDTSNLSPPGPNEPIKLAGLRVQDQRGATILESVSGTIPRPAHIALTGNGLGARDVLAQILGRQIQDYTGSVMVGGHEWASLPETLASRVLAYNGQVPYLFAGSLRDNVMNSLRRCPPDAGERRSFSGEQRNFIKESLLSGNPTVTVDDDWFDYEAAGVANRDELDQAVLEALSIVGLRDDIYRFGLDGRLPANTGPDVLERVVAARQAVLKSLEEEGLSELIAPFDPRTYNDNLSISENLLFGIPVGERLAVEGLACEPYFLSIIEAEALVNPLIEIGVRMAETTLEVFGEVAADSPLLEQYSFVPPDEIDAFRGFVEAARKVRDTPRLPVECRTKLLDLALRYIEPVHRLNLVDDQLRRRVLRGRKSFRTFLPFDVAQAIEFYEPDEVMMAAPLGDNLLFGRVSQKVANADKKIAELLGAVLKDHDLMRTVYALGLDYEVGPGGKVLFPGQRAAVAVARSLICRPDMFVFDGAFAAFSSAEAHAIVNRIRKALSDKTLIITVSEGEPVDDFDQVIRCEGARAQIGPSRVAAPSIGEDRSGSAPVETVEANSQRSR